MARGGRNTRRFDVLVAFTFIVGMAGVILLITVPATSCGATELKERRALMESLPDLTRAAHGERGVLEARVDEATPPLRAGLVVYLREEYKQRRWQWLEGQAQTMTVRTADGAPIAILNNDYQLDRTVEPWARTRRDEAAPTFATGAIRITGIQPSDSILVVGKKMDNGVIAESLAGISRKAYLAGLDQEIEASSRAPLYLLPIALPCLVLAFWLGRRLWREVADETPAEAKARRGRDTP